MGKDFALIAGNDIPTEREHAAISKQGCNFSLRSLPAPEYGVDYLLEGRQGSWSSGVQRRTRRSSRGSR